ncbi:MAG: hypothetical protein GF393_06270 [Armatimonadia bacterium]|nr:hypothetical protein [Armatimonadia bacterium]
MSDRKPASTRGESEPRRSRRSLLYATAILLVLMLIMSATAHLLRLRPAALVGFPIMVIGATSLLLVLLVLAGPDADSSGDRAARRAVDDAFVAALAVDPQTGRVLAANQDARDLLGPARLTMGSHFSELLTMGSQPGGADIIEQTQSTGAIGPRALSVRTDSGRPVVVEMTARARETDGEPFVVVGLMGSEVNEAVAEFARVQERLMSNISHELRTPLNVVMGFSELLTTGTLGELADNQLDAAKECHEGGERMLRLINDILDVGRSRSYYLSSETGPLSPVDMIRRVENLLSGQARREDLRIEVDLDDTIPIIETEERAFKQLVYHLILNGMRRTEAGGVVRVRACREDEHLVVTVADSGPDVLEDVRPQPAPSLSEKEATETLAPPLLGLPLCATLADRLGATLSTDTDAEGVRFIVSMPLLRS